MPFYLKTGFMYKNLKPPVLFFFILQKNIKGCPLIKLKKTQKWWYITTVASKLYHNFTYRLAGEKKKENILKY